MDALIQLGIVGLGPVGCDLAAQALDKNMHVVGYDPAGASGELKSRGIDLLDRPTQFHQRLETPRRIFLFVPPGKSVDLALAQLTPELEPGDVVVDASPSYWRDSIARFRKCRDYCGVHFVDCGIQGGARGARKGACFSVGGTPDAFALVAPLLNRLAVPEGLVHCGGPGSGHFVKLVHDGVELAMLQAVGEGVHLLEQHRETLPVEEILRAWNHGSGIEGGLIEALAEQYWREQGPQALRAVSESPGVLNELVTEAIRLEMPIPVISQALMEALASRDNRRGRARVVAMIRQGFASSPEPLNRASGDYPQSTWGGSWPNRAPGNERPPP